MEKNKKLNEIDEKTWNSIIYEEKPIHKPIPKPPPKPKPKDNPIIGYKVICHGGTNKTKTNEKIKYNNRNYTIYKGPRGGKYILVQDKFININHL